MQLLGVSVRAACQQHVCEGTGGALPCYLLLRHLGEAWTAQYCSMLYCRPAGRCTLHGGITSMVTTPHQQAHLRRQQAECPADPRHPAPQVRTLPKVLKFLPSDKAQDARTFVNSLQYWLGGNSENLENFLLNLCSNYVPALKGVDFATAEPQVSRASIPVRDQRAGMGRPSPKACGCLTLAWICAYCIFALGDAELQEAQCAAHSI
jgi:hypothetical protein